MLGSATFVAFAQQANDPRTWFNANQQWYQIVTNLSVVYSLDIADLVAQGFPDNTVPENELKMYRAGIEIPVEIVKNSLGTALQSGDKIRFMGARNSGKNERWAYGNNGADQSSDYYSLYSDSTVFWLTWSPGDGKRYQVESNPISSAFYQGFRDTVHQEVEATDFYPGYDSGAELSTYGESEGFYWYSGNLANQTNFNVILEAPINDIVQVDSTIFVEARMASQSIGTRTLRIDLLHSVNGSIAYHTIGSDTWSGKGGQITRGSVSPVRLVDYEKMEFIFRAVNGNTGTAFANPHLILFDWYRYSYFRGFTLRDNTAQFSFWLQPDGVRSIRFRNIQSGSTIRVYSPSQGKIFEAVSEPDIEAASFFDKAPSSKKEQYIAVKNNTFASPVRIRKYSLPETILSSDNEATVIILTRPVFQAQAQIYANYRASRSGVKTKVVLADEVWNLFGHGTATPKAIQDFVHYARRTWAVAPEYLFILADASFARRNTPIPAHEIPSFGYPSSDAWYGMNQNSPSDWIPRLSVGRLTVKQPSEIIAYLSKVSQYEANRPEYEVWQKRVTLLSGGLETAERELLLNHNLKLGAIAANSVIAADTIIIGKRSNQPLDESSRSDLADIINSGTFILHFFGHSSPDSWDLLTDNPNAYQNQGKPTIVLSLGCYSGLFTTSGNRVISEQFVFAPNAAVAFIGGSGQGLPSALQNYSDYFYKSLFLDTLSVLGDVDRQARIDMIRQFLNIPLVDLALVQNTNIIGDPSIRLAYPKQPDYRFDFDPVAFSPSPTSVADSSFQLVARIRNMGTLPTVNTDLTIRQSRPSLAGLDYRISLPPIQTVAEFPIVVKMAPQDAGLHRFSLTIDAEQVLEEYSEFNNRFEAEHQVFSTGADLIYPPDNSIHNSKAPLFVVSSPTIFNREIIDIQLDTVPSFENPIASSSIQGIDLNVEWQPQITLEQGKEYYWRAKVQRADEENWRTAQFLVDTLATGTWWQQTKNQFKNNRFSSSLLFDENQTFSFKAVNLEIRTSTLSWNKANEPEYYNYPASTFVNGEQMGRLSISFFMIVINGLTGEIRNGLDAQGIPRGQHYDVHPGIFTNEGALSREQFIQDLNSVRAGDYVILRVRNFRLISPTSPLFSGNNDPLLAALRSVGAFKATGGVDGSQTIQLGTTDGYILFGKKFRNQSEYDPSQVSEYIVKNAVFEADTVLSFNTSQGSMTTNLIGPVKKWHRLEASGNRISATGKIFVDIYGQQTPNSNPIRLTTANPTGLLSTFTADLSTINARQYPYLRLVARLENEDRRAPQLIQWRLQYDPVPELAINPFSVQVPADTLEEGYSYSMSINVQNLGLIDADTAIVEFIDVFRPTNGPISPLLIKRDTLRNLENFRKNSLPPPTTARRTHVTVPTINRRGNHTLQVRFIDSYYDQLAYNNFFSTDFYVQLDTIAPKIEVFFDNRFIPPVTEPITDIENPNLTYVSAKPKIDIYWKDSNPFLRIQDSTQVELRLFSENPNNYTRFDYSSPEVQFRPATNSGPRNEAYIQFNPDFSGVIDTVLTLQVFSRDRTGNIAENSKDGYMVSFRISSDEGITSFYPYPNPMSNFTNFAFELQGKDITQIERLRLKIFTLSGRPVKVVDLLREPQLLNDGQLRIGWNIYRWDGLDDDGNPLATGVYLYHVDFKAGGKQLPVNNKNSVEKLVIIR